MAIWRKSDHLVNMPAPNMEYSIDMGLCQEISSSPLDARTLVSRCFESLVL